MIVHLVDGTYELYRHFYGMRRFAGTGDDPYGAVRGVLRTVLQMLEGGATHLGVATDHVVESFRNDLWDGYKTGEGIDPALWTQFHPLEEALTALGVVVWPTVDVEADDALASAAHRAADDPRVERVCIWSPDKDLAQCVRGDRVVQVIRGKAGAGDAIRDEAGVRAKFGVGPERIPDLLALMGDAADGYPGLPGIGAKTAARLVARFGALEDFPDDVLGERRERALLFKRLAVLRTDVPVFPDVDALGWKGPTPDFPVWADRVGEPGLRDRAFNAVPVARPGPGVRRSPPP